MRNIKLAELNDINGGTCPFLEAFGEAEGLVVVVMPDMHPMTECPVCPVCPETP
jgi:hypothetical protein